jgi:F0F1-type ATP synthase membrane subunit b/b'
VSTQDPGRQPGQPGLTALPRIEELPTVTEGGYDAERVRDAFDAFRRHSTQLQAQLRVLQAAGRTGAHVEPTGHSVRMDALHLIRSAAEFADTLERDAQTASATQLRRTEEEVSRKQHELQEREAEVERYRQESERQRAEIVNAAKAEARELLANANRDASQELREAEAKGARLLEQSRHQATELTNSARAEVEQTLEWARAQAAAILGRAQQGAEQLLRAAGLGEDVVGEVGQSIVRAAEAATARAEAPRAPESATPTAAFFTPPVSEPEPEPEAEAEPEREEAPPAAEVAPAQPAVAPPPVEPPAPAEEPPPPPPLSSLPPVSSAPPGGPPAATSVPEASEASPESEQQDEEGENGDARS